MSEKNKIQEQLNNVFDAMVDLTIKMADKEKAEYNPTVIPAMVREIFNFYQCVNY